MLEKIIEVGLLFDFYGKLLTEKQQQAMLSYYYDDLSLGEIAERMGISRQGVYDHLHRAEDSLKDYEDKLELVARYSQLRTEIDRLDDLITESGLQKDLENEFKEHLRCIRKYL